MNQYFKCTVSPQLLIEVFYTSENIQIWIFTQLFKLYAVDCCEQTFTCLSISLIVEWLVSQKWIVYLEK
jgi:hypothetical protein